MRNWILVLLCASANLLYAAEDLGRFHFHDFLVEVGYESNPNNSFSIANSQIGFRWQRDENVKAFFRLGPAYLRNTPAWSSRENLDNLELLESYAVYANPTFGQFHLGLQKLHFGWEGQTDERDLLFVRASLFEDREIVLRDLGVGHIISHNGFTSRIVIHNGEGASTDSGNLSLKNEDERFFYTGSVSKEFDFDLTVNLGGQIGEYIAPGSPDIRKRRVANFYARQIFGDFLLHIEGTTGEDFIAADESSTLQFYDYYADLYYQMQESLTLGYRYEVYDQDIYVDQNTQSTHSGVLTYKIDQGHDVRIVYEHRNGENDTLEDAVYFYWRLSSQYKGEKE